MTDERTDDDKNLLRNALWSQGATDDNVDAALAQLISGGGAPSGGGRRGRPRCSPSRTASLDSLGGRAARVGGADYHELVGEDRGCGAPI